MRKLLAHWRGSRGGSDSTPVMGTPLTWRLGQGLAALTPTRVRKGHRPGTSRLTCHTHAKSPPCPRPKQPEHILPTDKVSPRHLALPCPAPVLPLGCSRPAPSAHCLSPTFPGRFI